ncbi:unnamed protein product, partial [Phaeothamnion confervicola]
DIASEPVFVKQKLAALVAGVAEREFPERWPEYLEKTLQLCQAGAVQAEIALSALTAVVEDCFDNDFNSALPAARRSAILSALNTAAPRLIDALYGFLAREVR